MPPAMPALDELSVGQSGRISKLNLNPSECQRLMEMGLTVGATVRLLRFAPLGDPIEILARGYHLSLRKAEAHAILVEPLPDTPP